MLAKKDTLDTVVVENDTDDTNGDTNEALVMRWIAENPTITQQELKDKLRVSIATVKRLTISLQKAGKIQRKGSNRRGAKHVEIEPCARTCRAISARCQSNLERRCRAKNNSLLVR